VFGVLLAAIDDGVTHRQPVLAELFAVDIRRETDKEVHVALAG
jgi:hypothetical protein